MGTRRGHIPPSWISVLLIVVGFLSLTGSYFLLPLYVTTLNCFDSCTPPKQATAWQFSLNLLSHLPVTPLANSCILVLLWLPLLAAVLVLGCSVGFLVHPRRAFVTWIHRGRLAGSAALVLVLLLYLVFLLGFIRPALASLGMLFGYGLLWVGSHLLVTAHA